jgi:hypothetical protein
LLIPSGTAKAGASVGKGVIVGVCVAVSVGGTAVGDSVGSGVAVIVTGAKVGSGCVGAGAAHAAKIIVPVKMKDAMIMNKRNFGLNDFFNIDHLLK